MTMQLLPHPHALSSQLRLRFEIEPTCELLTFGRLLGTKWSSTMTSMRKLSTFGDDCRVPKLSNHRQRNRISPSYGLWHEKSNWYPSKVDEPLQISHVQRVQPLNNDMYICYIAILQDFDDFDRTLIINPFIKIYQVQVTPCFHSLPIKSINGPNGPWPRGVGIS